ncbi:MAG: bifunctional UDP-sugar hydrolase/5'-nucleotidase [bacterium]
MIRILTTLIVFLLTLLTVFAQEVNIIHINDFHGRVVPEVQRIYKDYRYTVAGAEYISSIIKYLRENNKNVLVFDVGDFSAGTIYSNLSQGKSVVELYNYIGFDAICLGNHEFDFGYEAFVSMVNNLKSEVLCANSSPLFDKVKPYTILNRSNIKIAVIGLITPETPYITMPGALGGRTILDPVETLLKYKNEILNHNPDLVIALSHCGIKQDQKIAKEVDYVDIIIGGHSHTELFEPIIVENNNKKIYIVQAGSYGRYVGHIKLHIQDKQIKNFICNLYPTINAIITPDKQASKKIENYILEAQKQANQIIGKSEVTLDKNSKSIETNLGSFITNVIAAYTNSDIAFYNHGGIRDTLNKGDITYGQVFSILPFENTVVKFKMKGEQIVKLLDNLESKKTRLHYNIDLEKKEGKWFLKGKPIQDENEYTIATVDFLYYGGDGYTEFSSCPIIQNYGYARDIIVQYIKQNSPITSSYLKESIKY